MTEDEFKQLPVILKVEDIQKVLRIGRNAAYELVWQKNFPILELGDRKIRIPKEEFVEWIKKNSKFYQVS